MAKKKHDRHRLGIRSHPREIVTSSEPDIHPNATVGPEASLGRATGSAWIHRDTTSAPEIGEEERSGTGYAQSASALIDKYVLSRDFVPFALVAVGIGWIFLQDNGSGLLKTWQDLLWTLQKCGVLLAIFIVILFLQWGYKKWVP